MVATHEAMRLHGDSCPSFSRPATAILARSYRVHAYDQRGCGRSTRPFTGPLEGSFYSKLRTVEARLGLAAQIADIERIRRILGRDRFIVVGHSFGALIAALYAAEFPDRVRALVLRSPTACSSSGLPGPSLRRCSCCCSRSCCEEDNAAWRWRHEIARVNEQHLLLTGPAVGGIIPLW
jgi:pimeloyl-ACP methyl ester carboxylesterase